VGVFGGSFNPPHLAHGMVAAWLLWTEQVDEVWMVPVYGHPFAKDLAPFGRRVAACRALAGLVSPKVGVDEVESRLPTPSFTLNTLRGLAQEHPGVALRLVVGADILPQTSSWYGWEEIVAGFAPIVVGREGAAEVEGAPTFPAISSTAIRAALAAGRPVEHLVPPRVLAAWRG
jgi:nicotinate-nucleotide adenylyltransferase